jgi:hypothetical protein
MPKVFEHLRRRTESNHLTFLLNRQCREKDGYYSILPIGDTELRMARYLKDEVAVSTLIHELSGW